ncbi:hypothetical protein B0H19DRAFT_616258 [Mycena capillaripes]|nr:hypothetical protein B0H19DRAFT_616258 [Mycena capillaripes]
MASRASRASLDGLPNELLLEIVQKCIARDRGIAGASAFLIAAINRRFRSLALPYAFKEGLHVSSYKRLSAMFEPFRPHLSEIKTITVGHEPLYQISLSHDLHGYSFYKGRRFPARLDFPSLHNLVNFDCAGFSFEPRQLEQVFGVSNPRLQSLRLRWSAAHHFPFENFPSLQHLFVYIFFDVDLPEPSRPFPLVFPSLITLSVMTNMGWFSSKIEGQVIFPNLSAFHLLPNSSSSDLGFIYDNPTLREVSVSPVTVDFPSFVRLASLNHMEHPDSWNDLALNGFSFLRAAQQEHADPVALTN